MLLQFHEFIVSNLDLSAFESLLPSFGQIVKDFGVEPSVAFHLWRPILAGKVKKHDIAPAIEVQKRPFQDLAGNELLTVAQVEGGSSSALATHQDAQHISSDVEMADSNTPLPIPEA